MTMTSKPHVMMDSRRQLRVRYWFQICLAFSCAATGIGQSLQAQAQTSSTISASNLAQRAAPLGAVGFNRSRYNPAILRLSFNQSAQQNGASTVSPATAQSPDSKDQTSASSRDAAFLDLVLILPEGDLVGKRVEVSTQAFSSLLREFYAQLSKQAPLDVGNPQSPSRRLYQLLIAPLETDLKSAAITTLLLSLDTGLQAIPLAALHDGEQYFGVRYAYSLTPSLGLTALTPSSRTNEGQYLLAGSSRFNGLAPLPLVPQEVSQIGASVQSNTYLDSAFTPQVLLHAPEQESISRVHVATHAEFLPGGPQRARIYSGTDAVSLAQFASVRQRRQSDPMDLFVLSACRTAIGDKDSELGFAGLALQAGSRSAIGSLWYVDDVATSAFFIQFYSFLRQGLPKAEALQATRKAFASGAVSLQGDRILGVDSQTLLSQLTPAQQRRVASGMTNPYYWAGIQMLGSPW